MITNYEENSNIKKPKCFQLICILKTFTVKQDIINISRYESKGIEIDYEKNSGRNISTR